MNNSAGNGHVSLIGTIILGILSWFTPENVDLALKVVTGIGAVISAIFAARYYYYAAKEKKANLKRMKEEDAEIYG